MKRSRFWACHGEDLEATHTVSNLPHLSGSTKPCIVHGSFSSFFSTVYLISSWFAEWFSSQKSLDHDLSIVFFVHHATKRWAMVGAYPPLFSFQMDLILSRSSMGCRSNSICAPVFPSSFSWIIKRSASSPQHLGIRGEETKKFSPLRAGLSRITWCGCWKFGASDGLVGGAIIILKNMKVNGKDDIPYMKWKIKHVWKHQPVVSVFVWKDVDLFSDEIKSPFWWYLGVSEMRYTLGKWHQLVIEWGKIWKNKDEKNMCFICSVHVPHS